MGHGMKSLQEIRTLKIKQQQAEGKLKKIFKLTHSPLSSDSNW